MHHFLIFIFVLVRHHLTSRGVGWGGSEALKIAVRGFSNSTLAATQRCYLKANTPPHTPDCCSASGSPATPSHKYGVAIITPPSFPRCSHNHRNAQHLQSTLPRGPGCTYLPLRPPGQRPDVRPEQVSTVTTHISSSQGGSEVTANYSPLLLPGC